MKKILGLLSVICLMFFFAISSVQAAIYSPTDVDIATQKMYKLANTNLLDLINKNELIGYRLEAFNMSTLQYQTYARSVAEGLLNIRSRIDTIENSADYSDTEKEMQISQLYQEADRSLSEVASKTVWYLMELENAMPTITYQRYLKKFQEFYNELNIANNPISYKK